MNNKNKRPNVAEIRQASFFDNPFVYNNDISSKLGILSIAPLLDLQELADGKAVLRRLNTIDWAFNDSKTNYLSHDIHPYPAKFIPQIPRHLIELLSLPGELIWDPFGGSGTTALESVLAGRRAISSDINPLSEIIGKAKTFTFVKEEEDYIENLVEELVILSANAHDLREAIHRLGTSIVSFVPDIPNIEEWFHPNAIDELAYLRWRIEQVENQKVRTLAKASYSKSILRASYQDGETRYARRPRDVRPGEVVRLFVNNLTGALKKIREISLMLQFRKAEFVTLDLREAVVGDLPDCLVHPNSVDLVVTSPPYPNSTDYHLYHRFRLFWLGYDPREFGRKEIGSHLRHQREATAFDSYQDEMKKALENIFLALRPGRFAVMVLGDAIFQGKSFKTSKYLGALAQKIGYEVVGTIERPLHKTKRAFIAAARRAEHEDLMVLRKPQRNINIILHKPPYSLWAYEDDIRKKEVTALLSFKTTELDNGNLGCTISSLEIDKARKLTFTHSVSGQGFWREPTWQAVLENGDVTETKSRRKDAKYVTHGIHEYKGKFYPQLAKSLFNLAGINAGDLVLDPFCGSGTVLLESYLNGCQSIGFDMNPLAVKISHAKLDILDVDPYLRDRMLAKFQERLRSIDSSEKWINTFNPNLHQEIYSWFPLPAIGKLGWLLHEISLVPDVRVKEFLEVIVSSVIRQVSQQEPRDLRIRRREEPVTDAPVRELFEERLNDQRRRLLHFAERCNRSPYKFRRGSAFLGDSRRLDTFLENRITPGSVDAVLTSPPYATALPYIDTDRLSIMLILGVDSKSRTVLEESITGSREIRKRIKDTYDTKIDSGEWGVINSPTALKIVSNVRKRNLNSDGGFRKQNMAALLYRYFEDMTQVMTNIDTVLKPGASCFWVIGDTKTQAGDKIIDIQSSKVLREIGDELGWELQTVIPINVTTENRPHSKNSITENDIIWFKKAGT
ncbi:MAG TPA: DNA methyltransferase [Oculatellaceae cyanobacterium]